MVWPLGRPFPKFSLGRPKTFAWFVPPEGATLHLSRDSGQFQPQSLFHGRLCTQKRLKQAKCNCMPVVDAFLQGHAWWPKCIWTDSCIMHVQQSAWIPLNQAQMSTNCNGRLTTVPFLLKYVTTAQWDVFFLQCFVWITKWSRWNKASFFCSQMADDGH